MRSFLAPVVHRLAYAAGTSTRRAKRQGVMRILMLHGVGDRVFSSECFERVLRYLELHFELVSLAEIVHRTVSRLRIHGREIALTFDDGLRNNVTVAYPLLREMGVPATFFVCPELIDADRWLWNHEVRARMEFLEKAERRRLREKLGFEAPGRGEGLVESVIEGMKGLTLAERQAAESTVRAATRDFKPLPVHRRAYDVVGWDELKRLDAGLITIGSHTLTHPILPTLPTAALEREIKESRRHLEARLRREVEFFCYPNGDLDERVRALVSDTYRAAVTTEPGVVGVGTDLHGLKRIGVSASPASTAWRLTRP